MAWPNDAFVCKKKIVINHLQIVWANYLEDCVVLIDETDPELKLEEYGGKIQSHRGNDIVFTSSDGVTHLDHEIEHFDGERGRVLAWVRIHDLSAFEDTIIYMYYDMVNAPDFSNSDGTWASSLAEI